MSSLTITQVEKRGLSARDTALALAVVLPLAAIIAPYRHVHLPQLFILAVALLGGLYCFRLAIQDVEQLLFVFLLYIPFQKVLPGDFGGVAKAVNFTNAFLVLLLLGWVARPRAGEEEGPARKWTLLDSAVTVFLVIVTISMTAEALRETDQMRYETLSDLKRWLTPFAVYFLVTTIGRSTKTVKRMALAVVVTTAVIGLLGVKQFWIDMGGGSRHSLEEVRIEVTSGPSNLGAFFAYYLPYIVALWLGNIWRLAYWAFVLPVAWCMDALRVTFSRGAVVAFLAALAAIVWRRSKIAFFIIAPAVILAFYTTEITLPYSIFGRMAETYRPERTGDGLTDKLDKSARTRMTIWTGGVQMVKDNALFGVGYGQFPNQIGKYAPDVAGMDPHNNVLKIASEMGVPAVISFVLLIAVCFWRGYRLYGRVDDPLLKAIVLGYVGSVVGLFVANLFGSRLDSEEITTQFWAMTGGIVLIERFAHAEEKRSETAEGEYAGT